MKNFDIITDDRKNHSDLVLKGMQKNFHSLFIHLLKQENTLF